MASVGISISSSRLYLERRLQPVNVDELDKEASILVLKKRRRKYKRELDIEIPTDAITLDDIPRQSIPFEC